MNWDRVDSTIRQAFRKRGSGGQFHDVVEPARARTPLSELIAKEPMPDVGAMTESQLCEFAAEHHIAIPEDLSREELIDVIRQAVEVNWEQRVRGMIGLLDYLYADGPHPILVIRRALAVVKAVRPRLCFNMSCAQLAVLCDDGKGRSSDGRGTQSARIKRLFEEPIKKAGMKGCKAPFQKDASASFAYSTAQMGNKNRHGSEFLMELKLDSSNGTEHGKNSAQERRKAGNGKAGH